MMNKKLILSAASAAVLTVSCVSMYKGDGSRKVAGNSQQAEYDAHFNKIVNRPLSFYNKNGSYEYSDKQLASAANIPVTGGQIITNNDTAFQKKLSMIQSAQSEIRMVYFIYQNDVSSSRLNEALIAKAKAGVKVSLMVDFITNYSRFDLFEMLEREGNKNLKVYFYNFPRNELLTDINYLTLPCPQGVPANEHACLDAKNKIMDTSKIKDGTLTEMGELFLTGMYAKSTTAMMSALAKGAQINPEVYKAQLAASKQSDDVNSDDAKELGKIIIQAANGSLIAKIKLSIAMSMKGKLITPVINEITGRLPVTEGKENLQHGEAWDHLTDYTHHKLLVVDGNEFILGGRNVEDSYHMSTKIKVNEKEEKAKYVFMDTDFWAKTAPGGAKGVEEAFDKIVRGFMVKPLDKVKDYVKNGFVANLVRQGDGKSVCAAFSQVRTFSQI